MKILVTGGSGAVGRYVVDDLVRHGYQVGVLDRVAPARSDVAFHEVDVLQLDAVLQAMAGYEAVMHVAGIPHPLNDPAKRVFDVNVNGTFNVLEAAAQLGIHKVVFTSSESTMGFAFATHRLAPLTIPVDEAHPARPQDPYGLSKVVSEQMCKTYTDRYGMRTVCLRMPWVWLPEDDQRPFYRSLVAEYSNWYKNLWTFVDARDVGTAHRLALEVELENKHEAFFITGPQNWTGQDGPKLMAEFWPELSDFAPSFSGTDPLISHAKAQRLLGYTPQFSLQDTLGDLHP
jgi:UDP-glucose 4-epimerase